MVKIIISISLAAFVFASIFTFSTAKETENPKKIFEDNKCELCHSIKAADIEAKKKSDKNPDLSVMSADHEMALLKDYLNKKAEINNKKHPLPFRGSDDDLETLISWLKELHAANSENEGEAITE
ncbi:MAG: c-type cytochrome [Candidatus Kapaibacterium sp.]